MPPLHPVLDAARLEAVRRTGLSDIRLEEALDRLNPLAATLLRTLFAFVTVVDGTRSFCCAGAEPVAVPIPALPGV